MEIRDSKNLSDGQKLTRYENLKERIEDNWSQLANVTKGNVFV